MSTRMTVNLSDEVMDALKVMAEENGVTVTEQVRRAISTEWWRHGVVQRGERVLVEHRDGRTCEISWPAEGENDRG